jgi:hypothetical protein
VDAHGQVNIRRDSRLIVDEGATLDLSNGRVNIENGASLEIRPGGKLMISNTPIINLIGSNSRLLLNGEVVINENSTLQPTGNGFVEVRNPNAWSNFTAHSNSRIILNGAGPGDEVLRVSQGTFFVPAGITQFSLTNGRVNLEGTCQIDVVGVSGPSDNITIQNVSVNQFMSPSRTHRGIRLRGQQNITINNATFNNGAVGLTNNQEINGNNFGITNCTFSGNTVGIRTTGRSTAMNTCTFANNAIGWEGTNNIIDDCAVDYCTFSNGDQSVVLNNTSTTTGRCYFLESKFENNNFDITATNWALIPTCCQFINHQTAIRALNNSSVLLANNARNVFNSNRVYPDVLFDYARRFELENGNNEFTQPFSFYPLYFSGTFNNSAGYCASSSIINASGNRFGLLGWHITSAEYSLTASCPPMMTFVHLSQATTSSMACGENPGGGGNNGGPGGGNNGGGPGSGGPGQGGGGRLADGTPANNNEQSVSEISVYPSPFTESFSLAFNLAAEAQVTVELCNAIGQTVRICCDNSAYAAGSHTLNIDGQGLAGGAYFAKILIDGAVVKTVPVMKAD